MAVAVGYGQSRTKACCSCGLPTWHNAALAFDENSVSTWARLKRQRQCVLALFSFPIRTKTHVSCKCEAEPQPVSPNRYWLEFHDIMY